MKLKNIRTYVENQLKVDLTSTSRKRRNIYAKAIYYELAYIYSRECKDKKTTVTEIGKHINQHHSSVLHHRKNTMPIILKYEPEYKRVYDKFRDVRSTDLDADIREKYDVLMNDFIMLSSKYNDLEKIQLDEKTELKKLLKTINDDKIGMFIERAKPIIKMLNSSKFN